MTLTFDQYQDAARDTATYPRVYTEEQVRNIVLNVMSPWVEDFDTAAMVGNMIADELDREETAFNRLVYPVLGLLGEAGEIANKLKKVARDQQGQMTGEQVDAHAAEVGDVLWYVSAVSSELHYDLDSIAVDNINKLADRAARGVIAGDGDNR